MELENVELVALGINLTLNFTESWNASLVVIDNDYIYLENLTNGDYYYNQSDDWINIESRNFTMENQTVTSYGFLSRFRFLKEDGSFETDYAWNGYSSENISQIKFWFEGITEAEHSWLLEPSSVGYNDITLSFNETWSPMTNITFSLDGNDLFLEFFKDGDENATTGWIADLDKSRNFSGINYSIPMANLSEGLVQARFGLVSGENHTQFYEFINDYATDIHEIIEMLNFSDWYSYFKVTDGANTPLENAIIRAEFSWFGQDPEQWVYHKLFGQRLTTADGMTFFYADKNSEVLITVTKEGYYPVQLLVTIGDQSWTADAPYIIKLTENTDINDDAGWCYLPRYYYDTTQDIYGYIMAVGASSLKWTTTYRTAHGMSYVDISNLEDVTYRYPLDIMSGRDFAAGTPNEINISIYLNNALWVERTITYQYHNGSYFYAESQQGEGHNSTLHLETNSATTGIPDTILNPIYFILLIFISFAIGAATKNDALSEGTFKIGSAALIFLSLQFIWLTLIVVVHYAFMGLRKVISE